jgi:hypothetical protein
MPTLTVVLPLFLAERTAAPASEVATVLVTNTLGVAFNPGPDRATGHRHRRRHGTAHSRWGGPAPC